MIIIVCLCDNKCARVSYLYENDVDLLEVNKSSASKSLKLFEKWPNKTYVYDNVELSGKMTLGLTVSHNVTCLTC